MSRTLAIMISLYCPLVVIYALSICTSGYAAACQHPQTKINGRCCDMCPPGTYLKEFCSEHRQTVCSPCEDGLFSNTYNIFDRCEECQSCQQEYAEKCTPTTNANCSCFSGFLCSNNMCTKCEENKCVIGEKPMRTELDTVSDVEMIEYSYQCTPVCTDKEYYNAKEDICMPLTNCRTFGLKERFPGNKTHDSICDRNEISIDGGFIQWILGFGFILLSLTLFMAVSYVCIKSVRKHKADNNPIDIIAVSTNTTDFHLSKEESGLQLIFQDESKDTNNKDLCSCGESTL